MVDCKSQDWGGMAGCDTSSADESEEDACLDRHQRYARLARHLQHEEDSGDGMPAQAFTDEEEQGRDIRLVLSPLFFFFVWNAINGCLVWLCVSDGVWLFAAALLPSCLFSAAVEASLAWTDRDIARVRYQLKGRGKIGLFLFQLFIIVVLGCGYGYRLIVMYRNMKNSDTHRSFLTQLESLDPSKRALLGTVRRDAWTLMWGPPILLALAWFLNTGWFSLGESIFWVFIVALAQASLAIDLCNFDYYCSIHIRTAYGTVYDNQLQRWIQKSQGLEAMRNFQLVHFLWRLAEVIARVLVLASLAKASVHFPRSVALLLAGDFMVCTSVLWWASGMAVETVFCSIPLFFADIARFVDEPGLAYLALRVSRVIRRLRLVEACLAAASCITGSEFAVLAGLLAACLAHIALGLQTECGVIRDDLFTAIARGDTSAVQEMLSSDGGSSIVLRLRGLSDPTPLHFAVERQQAACVAVLVKHRANANLVDFHGDTPLHIACRVGDFRIVEAIVRGEGTTLLSENLKAHNDLGHTPEACLGKHADPRILELLREGRPRRKRSRRPARKPVVHMEDLSTADSAEKISDTACTDTHFGSDTSGADSGDDQIKDPREASTKMGPTSTVGRTFGPMLGRGRFHGSFSTGCSQGQTGDRATSQLGLTGFMFSRGAGEQTERLIEHMTARNEQVRLAYLTTLETLGAGGYGRVLKVKEVRTCEVFAMKLQKKDKATKQAVREAQEMGRNKHPYIVKLVQIFHTTVYYGILMEFCEKDLNICILQHSRGRDFVEGLPLPMAARYTSCMALALEYLHQNQVIFRDLKPENVLITPKELGDFAKLTDFGMAKSVADVVVESEAVLEATEEGDESQSPRSIAKRMTARAGTLAFMSDEAMGPDDDEEEGHDMNWYAARDWYSLGCSLMLILLGERAGRKIRHGKREVLLPPPPDQIERKLVEAFEQDLLGGDEYMLVLGLCKQEVKERYNSVQLRSSSFLMDAMKDLDHCTGSGANECKDE